MHLTQLGQEKENLVNSKKICRYTVNIRHSALVLSDFVSCFLWAYLRGAYTRRRYSYVLWAYLNKLTFLGGLSAGGLYHRFLRYV